MAEIVVEAQCEAKMSRARFETRGGFALDCSNENCIDLRLPTDVLCLCGTNRSKDKTENQQAIMS